MKHVALLILIFFLAVDSNFILKKSYAASQNECAIWLCLPSGFGEGCGDAKKAFEKRLRKGKSPLPSFSSCSTGGSGEYKLGRETYEPCKEGFAIQVVKNNPYSAQCVNEIVYQRCKVQVDGGATSEDECQYKAVRRSKPNFVKMWIEGKYVGQFYY